MADKCDFLLDRVAENARRRPTKVAVSFLAGGPNGGKLQSQLTYAELEEETTAIANRLVDAGIARGDRYVAIEATELSGE